jgi:hypothetical protein
MQVRTKKPKTKEPLLRTKKPKNRMRTKSDKDHKKKKEYILWVSDFETGRFGVKGCKNTVGGRSD